MNFRLTGLLLLVWISASHAALRVYDWNVENEWIAPDGFWRSAYTINGQTPGPVIEANQGDTVRVHVTNNLNVPITIHWHGLLMKERPWMDGVPGVTQWPILPKDQFTYDFPVENYGAFWYHSHTVGTYDEGIRGAIVFRPSDTEQRPWSKISSNTDDVQSMEQSFQRALPMVVYNWLHDSTETKLVRWKSSGILPVCFDSILMNGFGRVICPSDTILEEQGVAQPNLQVIAGAADVIGCRRTYRANYTQSNTVRCDATTAPFPVWQSSTFASSNGKYATLHLINAGTDAATSVSIDGHDMWVVMIDGRFVTPQRVQVANVLVGSRVTVIVPLRRSPGNYTIHSAASDLHQFQILSGYSVLQIDSQEWQNQDQTQLLSRSIPDRLQSRSDNVSINAIESAYVNTSNTTQLILSQDGRPSSFIEQLPGKQQGVTKWMQYNGTLINGANRTNTLGSAPLVAFPPPSGPGNLTIKGRVRINGLTWYLNDREFKALHFYQKPLLFQRAKDFNVTSQYLGTVYDAKMGDVVDMIFASSMSVDHPMHKHHEHVWIIGSGALVSGSVPFDTVEEGLRTHPEVFNLVDPPYRDTWPMQGGRYVVVRFKVNFSAVSLVHCHVEHHVASGMSIVIRQGMEMFNYRSIPASVLLAAHVPNVRVNTTSPVGLDSV